MHATSFRRRTQFFLLVLLTAVAAPSCRGRSVGATVEICNNGVDDDDDTWIDCGDPDCREAPVCLGIYECGDGVATGSEDCDGNDLRGLTCADVIPGSLGTLACEMDCRLDTMGCEVTGFCGDGVVGELEACDCGTDPLSLPPACTAPNGDPNSECDAHCYWSHGDCTVPLWDECDILVADECCPDDWGAATQCTPIGRGGESYCMRSCVTTVDCYWHNECNATLGGVCYLSWCGPGYAAAVNEFCTVAGGGAGWCAPLLDRATPDAVQYGICLESGTLAHGQVCPIEAELSSIDRSVEVCDLGLCLEHTSPTQGICRQLCDWEASYDAAIYGLSGNVLPCPAGANCLSYASLDPSTGVRSGDTAYCVDVGPMDHPATATTCSVVSGQLLSEPTTLCSDAVADGRCQLIPLPGGAMSNGTLVGVCAPAPQANKGVWDLCQPGLDTCAPGAACRRDDFFAANPSGTLRCLPLCDAQHHTGPGDCAALGAGDPTAQCRSLSEKLAPTDTSPTRLGLCALP